MAKTGRLILAVVAGAAVWAILWVAGGRGAGAAFPTILVPGQPLTHTGLLLSLIVYSIVLSLLAGFVTALAGGGRPMPAVWTLAIVQLAMGISFEAAAWSMTPVWYHIVFLLLLVPATVYGGVIRARRSS